MALLLAAQPPPILCQVTDVQFLGPPAEPTALAVATNSDAVRVFGLSSLSCSASLMGHRDAVLALEAVHIPAAEGDGEHGVAMGTGHASTACRAMCLALGLLSPGNWVKVSWEGLVHAHLSLGVSLKRVPP